VKTLRAARGQPLAVQLLLVNQFGVNTGFYLLIPYLAWHLDAGLGMSAMAIGIVLGVRNLSQQGLFIIGGSAADRLGARRVIIAGCGLRTLGFGLFALGDDLVVLLAASVLSGVAGALFNPAVRAYIAVESGDRKAEAFALFHVFANAGALAGPLLGSVLLLWGDFRASALTAAAIFAVLTVAQAMVLPGRAVPAGNRPGVLSDWREVLTNRRFLAFALAMTGLFTLETQLYLLLPDGARIATGWAGSAGMIFLIGTLTVLALQLRLTTRLTARRGGRGRWIALGLALMGLAFVPPLLVTGRTGLGPPDSALGAALRLIPVLVGALLLYLGAMMANPFVMELIPSFGRASLTGTYYGVFYVISGLAAAAGNTAVGWAMDTGQRAGMPWLPWLCCLSFGLCSAAAVAWLSRRGALPRPEPKPRPEPDPTPGRGTDREAASERQEATS
jgi:predicted MFS family arabinose efflux permease